MQKWHAWLNTPGHRKQTAFFQALTECVESVQHDTGATVAVALRPASGTYLDVAFLFGFVLSWFGLLLILVLPYEVPEYLVLIDVLLVFLASSWLCARTRLRAWLTPRRRQRRQVKTAAHAAFFEEGTHHMHNERDVLIYWSRLERRIEVLAGPAILHAVPIKAWNHAVFVLRAATQQANADEGFLMGLRQLGKLLAEHVPPDALAEHAHLKMWRS
jgi:uncharacterized membrane protein